MVKLSDELPSRREAPSRKIIVCINGLPPAVRGAEEFLSQIPLSGWGRTKLSGIKLSLKTLNHWSGDIGGNATTILDFKTIEGLIFDEYAMENDR